MLWPLTITCIDESGNRLPGAAIQVRETLNPSVSVPTYDIDYQLVASPVAGPTGMATVFLRNGYIDSRYVLDPYESEWITDLALAPSGRAGRWRDDVGGAIAAGTTTDFTINPGDLGVEKSSENLEVTVDLSHDHMEDLTLQLVRTGIPVEFGGPTLVTQVLGTRAQPGALSGVVTFRHRTGEFTADADGWLDVAVSDTDTTFVTQFGVTPTWPFFSLPAYYRIESEIVRVTAGVATTSWTVERGQFGTTAVAHDPGATFNLIYLFQLGDGVTVPFDTSNSDPVNVWSLGGEQTGGNMEGDWKLRAIDAGTTGGTVNNWTLTSPANLSFT
jgi:hypothetical protein